VDFPGFLPILAGSIKREIASRGENWDKRQESRFGA
jgi:hypothetical protein